LEIGVAVVGFLVSIMEFFVSFSPPTSIGGETADETYMSLLVVCFLVVLAIPFIVYPLHDKRGKKINPTLVPIKSHNAQDGHFFVHPRARPTHYIIVDDGVSNSKKQPFKIEIERLSKPIKRTGAF